MNSVDHEAMRTQLPVAAAGAVNGDELTAALAHTAGCESCRRELYLWGSYARGLRQLPQLTIPAHLLRRTQVRVLQYQESSREKRQYILMVGAFVLLSWTAS